MNTPVATRVSSVSPAVLEALTIGSLPDTQWDHEDDLCDCTYQRIGLWKNPYLAETLEVRMCCIWAELYKQFPDFVRTIPGYYNDNTKEWETKPWEWNGEAEMPRAIWYRYLAREQDRPLADIRAEYSNQRPPSGRSRIPLFVYDRGEWALIELNGKASSIG